MKFNLPLVLKQCVCVTWFKHCNSWLALAAHKQTYHKRLLQCLGKLDREIKPVHMFLFERFSIRPQRDRFPEQRDPDP